MANFTTVLLRDGDGKDVTSTTIQTPNGVLPAEIVWGVPPVIDQATFARVDDEDGVAIYQAAGPVLVDP